MKKQLLCCCLLLFSLYLEAQISDTVIRKVHTNFNYNKNIFPESWQEPPINSQGVQIDTSQIQRCKTIIAKALSKYPEVIFQYNLKYVYFLKELKFYDVGYGGTNSLDAVYITNEGISLGYTDKYFEQTFHHEFSSILLRNYSSFLDTAGWLSANAPGFIYNDPENGVGAIRNNQSSQELDTLLFQKGLLTQYGGSGFENDVNTFAQNLFCPEKDFWNYVDRFPGIKKKVDLLIIFYSKISAVYSEAYFRKMDKQ